MTSKIPSTVCSALWSHFAISSHPDGFITQPCCRFRMGSDSRWNKQKFQTPSEAVSKDGYFEQIRQKMLAGEKLPECQKCWRDEKNRGYSMRKTMLKQMTLDEVQEASGFDLRYLEIFFSNLCNLSCRMCDITQSSQWANLYNNAFVPNNLHDRDVVPEEFLDATGKAKTKPMPFDKKLLDRIDLSNLNQVKILGGEPMMTPDHLDFLNRLMSESKDPSKIKLVYHSNGTKRPPQKVIDYWKQMEEIELVFSIDGYGKTNEYQRVGSDWDIIVENIKWYAEQGVNLNMRVHSVLSILTVWTVDNLCEWLDNEFKTLVNWPNSRKGLFDNDMKTVTFDFAQKPSYLDLTIMPEQLKSKCCEMIEKSLYLNDENKNFIIDYIKSNSYNKEYWETFWKTMTAIDKHTGQNISQIAPQLEEYKI